MYHLKLEIKVIMLSEAKSGQHFDIDSCLADGIVGLSPQVMHYLKKSSEEFQEKQLKIQKSKFKS